jgi:hypothetical protein
MNAVPKQPPTSSTGWGWVGHQHDQRRDRRGKTIVQNRPHQQLYPSSLPDGGGKKVDPIDIDRWNPQLNRTDAYTEYNAATIMSHVPTTNTPRRSGGKGRTQSPDPDDRVGTIRSWRRAHGRRPTQAHSARTSLGRRSTRRIVRDTRRWPSSGPCSAPAATSTGQPPRQSNGASAT